MDYIFICILIFLFLLAIFDLSVGVSNDAVNFINSAIGSKAASVKRILIVASIGVFIGAAMSNGMMDIARHGIFRPEHFSFYELICIFMAVMVTDIILLDVFNTLGMPTSTTVSMVFELLGATFVVALIKMTGTASDIGISELINTEKALSVILGIFLSIAIAFIFGTIVQFVSRAVFSFNYRHRLRWKIGIFGGLCTTAIIYFILIKGTKDLTFMTPEVKQWINANTMYILGGCLMAFTIIMQVLHALRINVLKTVVLIGTFSLAMAFAGNDLVNFIGVPVTGLESYMDYSANGAGDAHGFLMGSLNGPASTPFYFLVGAGVIMVVSLATSKKARNVSRTEIGLGSQSGGDEMFGSSRIARRLVRWTLNILSWIRSVTPQGMRRWLNSRFNVEETDKEAGAAFDLIRGSVNLVLAGTLIALGTSLKLPLSTTFVTFMVAMGTSLADRAWSRESAVFRITGVISVIGGWFITAGVAFIGAGLIVSVMYWGGKGVMLILAVITIILIIRSNRRFRNRRSAEDDDTLFRTILSTDDKSRVWPMFLLLINDRQKKFLTYAGKCYDSITLAFLKEDLRTLDKTERSMSEQKKFLKNDRRKETLCWRTVNRTTAIEKSAWFHLSNNCCMSMLYNLRRINETCKEHIENNFLPLPSCHSADFNNIRSRVDALIKDTVAFMNAPTMEQAEALRHRCDDTKRIISGTYHNLHSELHEGRQETITVLYVYLNMLQETRELISSLRKYLRACAKLHSDE